MWFYYKQDFLLLREHNPGCLGGGIGQTIRQRHILGLNTIGACRVHGHLKSSWCGKALDCWPLPANALRRFSLQVIARRILGAATIILCFQAFGATAVVPSTGDVALSKADALADIYNWHEAAPYYAEAERAFSSSQQARNALLAHIGYVRATFETRSFAETARYFAQTCSEPIIANDRLSQFRCLVAKGDTDAEIDSAPAEADWRGVLALAQSLHNQKWVTRATGEIGFQRYVQGDITTAKKNTAIALLQCHKTGDWAGEIRFSSGIGTGLGLAGSEKQAIPYLESAIRLAQQHPESGYPYMAVAGMAMTLNQKGNYNKAEPYAFQEADHAKADQRLVKYTQAQLFLADIAIGRGQRSTAIKILTDTLPLAEQNHTRLVREAYSKLSDLYRQQGNLKQADRFAESALVACQYSHDIYLVPHILLNIARIRITLGKDAQANALLQRATDLVEGMLVHTTDVRARDALLDVRSDVYQEHFALAAKHNDVALAFAILEQVRGRLVFESLVNKKSVQDLNEWNSKLEDQISSFKFQLVKAKTDRQRQSLADQLFFAEQARWVQLRNITLRRVAIPSLRRFRSRLPNNRVFLEYVLTDDASYCLVVSKLQARIVRLPGQHEFEARAKTLLDDIRENKDTLSSGRALFSALVEPIGDLSQYRTIEISPDGILNTIPFEVLRTPKNTYWASGVIITYTPSAGADKLLSTTTTTILTRTFLGLGGVPYDSTDRNIASSGSTHRGNEADPYDLSTVHNLPSSEEEIRTAANVLNAQPATLKVGESASKTEFEKENVAQYAVIHFAVHARADVTNPDLSYLLLNAAPNKDGFLQPRDIMQRDLPGSLVVLSACDTSIGHLQGEEGVANLSRSFLIAGASAVVSTLWKIDDTYSLFLTKSFYEHLNSGESAGDSLRAAKMAVLAKFGQATPAKYWAGFVLTGNGDVKLSDRPLPVHSASLQKTNDVRNYH